MPVMNYDVEQLARRIKDVPFRHWGRLALAAGVAESLPRKIVYEQERNFGIRTIAPLAEFFARVDRGEAQIPADEQAA